MAASKCSPAVASRLENYVDEFRVPTLLGPKLRSHKFVLAANEHYFCDGYLRLYSVVPEGRAGRTRHALRFWCRQNKISTGRSGRKNKNRTRVTSHHM